jgi:single-stranded DNA-binding protein
MANETSVNKCELSGFLQDNSAIRETKNGNKVLSATLVLVDKFVGDKPMRQWLRLVSWRGLAVRMAEMPTGCRIRVRGRLHTNSWKGPEQEWKHRLELIVDSCEEVRHLQTPPRQADIDKRKIDDSDIPF